MTETLQETMERIRAQLEAERASYIEHVCEQCAQVFRGVPDLAPILCCECESLMEERHKERLKRAEWLELADMPSPALRLPVERKDMLETIAQGFKGLYIHGPQGTGKTVFACHLLRHLCLECGERISFMRATKFIIEAQSRYRSDSGPASFMWDVCTIPVFCLDDLGKQKWTGDAYNFLFELISAREATQMRTIITSNLSLKELGAVIEPAIASRIAGMCEVLHFTGKDRRLT